MKHLLLLLAVFSASTFTPLASSTMIGQAQFIAPLSPDNPKGVLDVRGSVKADVSQPIWVKYHVIAISAQEKPEGRITIDAAPELVRVPMGEGLVHFSADDMDIVPRSGKFAEMFNQQAGSKTPEEIAEYFGPNLAQAIVALKENKGSMLEKTIIKTYAAPPDEVLALLASIEKAEGIYPAYVQITMGQGDIPATAAEKQESLFHDKLVAFLIAFGIAAVYLYKKFTS